VSEAWAVLPVKDMVEAKQRLAIPAEYDFVICGGIADCCHHLINVRLTLETELVPLDSKVAELSAEAAAVGAAVSDVEVKAVADYVSYPCSLVYIAYAEKTPCVEGGDAGDIFES